MWYVALTYNGCRNVRMNSKVLIRVWLYAGIRSDRGTLFLCKREVERNVRLRKRYRQKWSQMSNYSTTTTTSWYDALLYTIWSWRGSFIFFHQQSLGCKLAHLWVNTNLRAKGMGGQIANDDVVLWWALQWSHLEENRRISHFFSAQIAIHLHQAFTGA